MHVEMRPYCNPRELVGRAKGRRGCVFLFCLYGLWAIVEPIGMPWLWISFSVCWRYSTFHQDRLWGCWLELLGLCSSVPSKRGVRVVMKFLKYMKCFLWDQHWPFLIMGNFFTFSFSMIFMTFERWRSQVLCDEFLRPDHCSCWL